jgi:hypothetical protein
MVNAMLSTQLVDANISAEDKTKIIFLAAGMISKVAGQETPFQDVLEGTKTLPGTVLGAIQAAAVEIAQQHKYKNMTLAECMTFGKAIGKGIRNELSSNRRGSIDKLKSIITSNASKYENALIVPEQLINQIKEGMEKAMPQQKKLAVNKSQGATL